MTKNKCIMFDFEGTMIDSISLYVDYYNKLAKWAGFNPVTRSMISSFSGCDLNKFVAMLNMPKFLVPIVLLYIRKQVHRNIDKIKLVDGIMDEIIKIKSKNYLLGIVSTSRNTYIQKYLLARQINQFDFIETTLFIENKSKLFTKIIQRHHLINTQMIYIGDEVRDILSSKKSHIYSAGVTWGAQGKAALLEAEPDILIENPIHLYDEIETFFAEHGNEVIHD